MNRYKANGETRPGMIIPHFSIEAGYLRLAFHDGVKAGQPDQPGKKWAAKFMGDDLYLVAIKPAAPPIYGFVENCRAMGLTPESVITAQRQFGFHYGGRNTGDRAIFDNLLADAQSVPDAIFAEAAA